MSDESPPYPPPSGPPPPGAPGLEPHGDPGASAHRRERPASLARRVVPAAVILGAAGGLLVALDHPGPSAPAGAADGQGAAVGTQPTAPTTTPPATRSPTSGSGAAPSTTTTTVPSAPTCTGTTSTVTGSTVQTRYGPVQVQATIDAAGNVCSATALQSPNSDRKSVSINQRAVPTLVARTLAADGADFTGVSGATITSDAYKSSLQSILDKK